MTPDVNEFLTLLLGTGVDDPTAARALAIGYAESGASASAVSPPNSNGTIDYGFMQINSGHFEESEFRKHGWNSQTMLQLGPNIDAAHYLSGGWKNWRPWSTFNDNAYLAHIDQAKADVASWHKSKGNLANPGAMVSSATSNIAAGAAKLNPIPALIGWLNPLAKSVGIGILGMMMLTIGVVILISSSKAGKAAIKAGTKVAEAA